MCRGPPLAAAGGPIGEAVARDARRELRHSGAPRPTAAGRVPVSSELAIVGASRGNPFSPLTGSGAASPLFDALERRYGLVGRIDVSLTQAQRAAVAAASFPPSRARWRARFYR